MLGSNDYDNIEHRHRVESEPHTFVDNVAFTSRAQVVGNVEGLVFTGIQSDNKIVGGSWTVNPDNSVQVTLQLEVPTQPLDVVMRIMTRI